VSAMLITTTMIRIWLSWLGSTCSRGFCAAGLGIGPACLQSAASGSWGERRPLKESPWRPVLQG
jgi:hypothetical protein